MRVSRRGLQLALAWLWLLDAALQFQPFMFTRAFGHDVIGPAGDGQPAPVAASVHFAGSLVATHPVLTNVVFATVQLAIAVGLFARRSARLALVSSMAWSAGVWWFGEGAGGLFSGHAMLLSGAPGAVLLYALLAAAALPDRDNDGRGVPPRRVALVGWAGVWLLGGFLQLLPGQNSAGDVAGVVRDSAEGAPAGLAASTVHVAGVLGQHSLLVVALVVLQFAIGVLALRHGAPRSVSCALGAAVAVLFWVFAQGIGELATGQSTDPNSAPLLVVLAFAAAATRPSAPVGQRAVRRSALPAAGLRQSVAAS